MPVYSITDSKTGQTMDVRGDSPPTQEEAAALFAGRQAPGRKRTWTDTAVDALPAIGGAVGGTVGGIGGTAFGMGIGGMPGAVGGAALGGGAGEAAKQLVNRVRGESAPPTMGAAAGDIGLQAGVQGAMEGAGQAAMPALGKLGESVYRGYLKPSLSRVNLPKAAEIVKNAIAEGLPVTQGGLQRADALIGQLNGKVEDLLSQATGKTVDLGAMANDVRTWAKQMFDRPGRDPRDYEAALKVADRIDGHPSVNPTSFGNQMAGKTTADVDMVTANQVKRDLQRSVSDKFGVPTGSAETATEKAGSGIMRRGIEAQVPEVGPLNARQSRLMDVAKSIARATGREENKSPLIGVNTMLSGAIGGEEYARTGNPAAAAAKALGVRLALTPAAMTRAAIIAVKLSEKIPGTAVADVARVAVEAAKSESEKEP